MKKVGTDIIAQNASWNFDGIADHFDSHIAASVPFYSEGHDLVVDFSDFFLPQSAIVTEIGVSTGALARKFLDHHRGRDDITYVGIDPVQSMIEKARDRCVDDSRGVFECGDILVDNIGKNSLIISYYTIQFIHPRHRQDVFNKIYESLDWGGALLVFEKVRAPDARFQDISTQVYQDFKLKNNFTEAEIFNKSRSLKGVLEPFSTQGNIDLMRRAGFVDITTIFKWVCFEGFLAIK